MNFLDSFLKKLNESTKPRVSIKGFVVLNGKILVLRMAGNEECSGKWDIPGGGIEDGENPQEAFRRELKEETSLEIVPGSFKLLPTIKNFDIPENGIHAKWKFCTADVKNGDVIFNPSHWKCMHGQSEHNEYKWIKTIEEAEQLDMCDEMKSLLIQQIKKL